LLITCKLRTIFVKKKSLSDRAYSYWFKLEKVIQDKMMMMMMMFLKLETDKKTKKKYVNMHMQTKFFLWEGLVELLLWKLRTIFNFVKKKKKSLSDNFKFLGRLK